MYSENIKSIHRSNVANNLLTLAAQKDLTDRKVEFPGDDLVRLSDGTILRRHELEWICGFLR